MTYQVLARKWRPKNFGELVGQEHVLRTLGHALDKERLHHAYLFTGTRGVGKTTIARILAKCLNCEQGISSVPCEQCDACIEINNGRFMDLIEVDAASRTKVEDTRELLDNVQYAPSKGRFKVYLIDEVHMLSGHSFNALLKTLEEPPPHVKFLLATTDPQKLPVTILSRCLQFNLKNLSPAKIVDYLQQVLQSEGIDFDEAALWHLAGAAAGSMRDALTLLDQAISFGEGEVREPAVVSLLGTPDQRTVLGLVADLRDRDAASLLETVATVAEHNPDFARLLEQLLSSFHRIATAQLLPDAVDNSQGDRKQILELAAAFSAEDVQLYYQIALNTLQDMNASPDRRMAFEMGLLRMLAFSPEVFHRNPDNMPELVEEEQKKKPTLSSEPEPIPDPAGLAPTPPESTPEPVSRPVPEPGTEPIPEPAQQQSEETPAQAGPLGTEPGTVSDVMAASGEMADEAEADDAAVADEAPAADIRTDSDAGRVGLHELGSRNWWQVVEQLPLSGLSGNVLANCDLQSCVADQLVLVLDEQQSTLYRDEQCALFAELLSEYFGHRVSVRVETATPQSETPAARRQRLRRERAAQALETFAGDPVVRDIMERFSARIVDDSLQYPE